jgi:DNA recombination protein RmuC
MNIVAIAVVVAAFALLAGWWIGSRTAKAAAKRLSVERDALVADRARFQTQAEELRRSFDGQKIELESLRGQCAALTTEGARKDEQLKAAQQLLAAERASFTNLKNEMENTFTALAADALKNANDQFLGQANLQFDSKQLAIDALLTPVKERLNELNVQTHQLEVKREGAYRDVLAEVRNIQQTHEGLRLETNQLVQALRAPKVRGNWGEEQLTRCLEFAGMVKHCDFNTQVYVRSAEDKAQQPDVVVKLPNERTIVIDSKNLLYETFYLAINSSDESEKKSLLQRHATQVRKHLDDLSSKSYWNNFRDSPDFVVCFLPSEALFSAALEQDPSLIEYGSNGDVILATPTTLIALLKAVAYGWQQMKITRNAMAIRDEADKLYKKLATAQEYFVKLGKTLAASNAHYNYLVGTVVEGRGGIFTQSRKLHELGVGADELPEVKEIEAPIRQLQSDDWQTQEQPAPLSLAAAEGRPEEE